MHTVFALLCFVVVIHWLILPYPSGLLHWHCGILTIAPVPAKQPWWILINTSCEFIMNDCITTTKQSTTKPCAYFLGYTVPMCICGTRRSWLEWYQYITCINFDKLIQYSNLMSGNTVKSFFCLACGDWESKTMTFIKLGHWRYYRLHQAFPLHSLQWKTTCAQKIICIDIESKHSWECISSGSETGTSLQKQANVMTADALPFCITRSLALNVFLPSMKIFKISVTRSDRKWQDIYRKVSNIRRAKCQNLNDSRLFLQLSVPNPLKPSVKSIMKM